MSRKKPKIDFTTLTPTSKLSSEDAVERALLEEMIARAHDYLESFDWCSDVVESYVGDVAIGGVVAVLLYRIVPARKKVDEWLWVVVGDLPPAYLALDEAPSPAGALAIYIDEMQQWVDAVKAGRSVEELIPVETSDGSAPLPPTRELADALGGRLRYLTEEIVLKTAAASKHKSRRRNR